MSSPTRSPKLSAPRRDDFNHYYSHYLAQRNQNSPQGSNASNSPSSKAGTFNLNDKQQAHFKLRMNSNDSEAIDRNVVEGTRKQILQKNRPSTSIPSGREHVSLLDRALDNFLVGDSARMRFGNITKSAVKVIKIHEEKLIMIEHLGGANELYTS
jgi:hypothetical protein